MRLIAGENSHPSIVGKFRQSLRNYRISMTVTDNHTEREKNIADKRNLMYEHQAS
jgi:hypothetical protein